MLSYPLFQIFFIFKKTIYALSCIHGFLNYSRFLLKRKVFVPLKVSSQTPRFSGVGPFPKFVFARIFPIGYQRYEGKKFWGDSLYESSCGVLVGVELPSSISEIFPPAILLVLAAKITWQGYTHKDRRIPSFKQSILLENNPALSRPKTNSCSSMA